MKTPDFSSHRPAQSRNVTDIAVKPLLLSLTLLNCCAGIAASQTPASHPKKPIILHPASVLSVPVSGLQHTDVESMASTKVSLSVNNGTLMDFVPAIGSAMSPKPLALEVRHNTAFRVSLTLSDMPVEDVLRGLAGFAHCNLYVLPDRFLICPASQLKSTEKAIIIRDMDSQGAAKRELAKRQ